MTASGMSRSLYIFSIDNKNALPTKVSLFVRFLGFGSEGKPFTKVYELQTKGNQSGVGRERFLSSSLPTLIAMMLSYRSPRFGSACYPKSSKLAHTRTSTEQGFYIGGVGGPGISPPPPQDCCFLFIYWVINILQSHRT